MPLQAYFRINAENMGQFERTLIIVDEGAYVHYVEGCTAPIYSHGLAAQRRGRDHRQAGRPLPLHDHPELVEERLQPGDQARRGLRRTPRWSGSTATSGSKLTMKYPAIWLMEPRRARRSALDRLRRRRAAPGRRRQGGARGAAHLLDDHLQVDQQGRRAHVVSRPAEDARGRRPLEVDASSATRCCWMRISRTDTYPYIEIERRRRRRSGTRRR